MGMFGDTVVVTTTLDSLGVDNNEEDDGYESEAVEPSSRSHNVDAAQKYAYSFKSVKEKMDAKPLSTKRERKAQRNKSQSNLDRKTGVKPVKSASKSGPGKGKPKEASDSKTLTNKALKIANFGKKKKSK